jgi:hypothetical protein
MLAKWRQSRRKWHDVDIFLARSSGIVARVLFSIGGITTVSAVRRVFPQHVPVSIDSLSLVTTDDVYFRLFIITLQRWKNKALTRNHF